MNHHMIITHIDGDGVCAASLCIKGLVDQGVPRDDIRLIFTQPYKLVELLESLVIEQDVSKVHIYILDLAYRKGILAPLQQFNKATYIDHHSSSLTLESSGIEPLVDQYRSCSQLVCDYFDLDYSPLVTLGTVCDKLLLIHKSDPMWNETELLRTSLVYNIEDHSFRHKLVNQLVAGKLPSEIHAVKDNSSRNNQRITQLISLINKNILIENDTCIIAHAGTENIKGFGGIVATKLAVNAVKPVFILYKDGRQNLIVITSRNHRNNPLDLSLVMRHFDGGGHRMAAGGAIKGNHTYKDVATMILNIIDQQVGA